MKHEYLGVRQHGDAFGNVEILHEDFGAHLKILRVNDYLFGNIAGLHLDEDEACGVSKKPALFDAL